MSPSAAAGAGTPSSASKLSSSFNTQARDDHARKEQEELAKRVKVEQALKKDAQVRGSLYLNSSEARSIVRESQSPPTLCSHPEPPARACLPGKNRSKSSVDQVDTLRSTLCQAKIKMQMAEDKIVRRLTQTVRKASSLGYANPLPLPPPLPIFWVIPPPVTPPPYLSLTFLSHPVQLPSGI